MAIKVLKCKIKREKGYLYYLDKKGNVSKAEMARGKKKGGSPKVVVKAGIKRDSGYLYFIDKQGDVAKAKMARGKKKKKAAKKVVKKKKIVKLKKDVFWMQQKNVVQQQLLVIN